MALCHVVGPLHDATFAQGPDPPTFHVPHQILQRTAGATQGLAQILRHRIGGSRQVPALGVSGQLRLCQHHQIQPVAAAHRVLHTVHVLAHPDHDILTPQGMGQNFLGHQDAVGQMAGGTRRCVFQQQRSHTAPQAIRTDQRLRRQRLRR